MADRDRRAAFLALTAAALGLLSLAVSGVCLERHFEGGLTYEFCQYAEIGRNILEGKGFRTAAVSPSVLAVLDARGIPFDDAHLAPVLDRFPLQAYLSAAAEAVFGKNDGAVALLSAVLISACAIAVFAAGCGLFSPFSAGLAALFTALNPSFQRGFLLWGVVDFGFLLLILASTCGLYLRRSWSPLLLGLASGLAYLSRSNLLLFLPFILARLWTLEKKGRSVRLLGFSAAFLALCVPSLAYTLRWSGSLLPHALRDVLSASTAGTASPSWSYRQIGVWEVLSLRFPALALKFRTQLWRYLGDFPTLWQTQLIFPAFLYGLWRLETGPRSPARGWVRLMLAALAVHVLVFSALRYEAWAAYARGRHFLWFAPALFLVAAHGAEQALGRRGAAVFGLANILFFWTFLASPQGGRVHPRGLRVGRWPELAAAAKAAGEGLLLTNLPAQAAWYTRHRAVTLPADEEQFAVLGARHPVGAILISRLGIGELGHGPFWSELIRNPARLQAFCGRNRYGIIADFGTAVLLGRLGGSS